MNALAPLLLMLVTPILSRIIGAIGFGLVSYTGVKFVLEQLEDAMRDSISGMPPPMFAILSIAGLGNAITVIMSALLIRAYMNGMNTAGNVIKTNWTVK